MNFKKIKDILKKIFCTKHFVLLMVSACLIFAAGGFNKTSNIDDSASYYSSLVKESGKKYLPLIVEQKTEDKKMIDTSTEFRSLYGAFGKRNSNFAGTINADKKDTILFEDIECQNLSFCYVNVGFSNPPEKEDSKYKGGYRQEFYPLHLLYKGNTKTNKGDFSFLYLSTSQADKLIALNNEYNNYDDLIGKSVKLSFNGTIYSWTIDNIYLEEDYFYNAMKEVVGEFVLGYRFYPEGFHKQATFFLNEHEFENKFYLNYILNTYDKNDYNYLTSNFGVEINNERALAFANNKTGALSIVLAVISLSILLLSLFFIFKSRHEYKFWYKVFNVFAFLIPYFVAMAVATIVKSVYFFSPYSTIFIMFMIIGYLLFLFVLEIYEKIRKIYIDYKNKKCVEIEI